MYKDYTLKIEIGLILSLLIMIGIFRMEFTSLKSNTSYVANVQEEVMVEEVVQTKQIETPPAPPRPPVPIEVPNDEVIEDEFINMSAELELDAPMELPPPPPAVDDKDEEENFFVVVEQMPELKDGITAIHSKLKYPDMALKAGIEGRVVVQFIVNEKGEVENPRVVRGIGGGCDEEALRVIRDAEFIPGMQRGRPVRVQYSIPITFKLQHSN